MTDSPLPGQRIDAPLPPVLAKAFGYRGNTRYGAFHWFPVGEQNALAECYCTE